MPFQNRSQESACWAQYNQALKEGKKPKWDCEEWEHPDRKKKKSDIRKAIGRVNVLIEKSIFILETL